MIGRELKILALGCCVAVGTFAAMTIAAPVLFTGMGAIFPMFVAWAAGATFALSRQSRFGWLHVALIGILAGSLAETYFAILRSLYPPMLGLPPGGPNVNPPGLIPIPPK